MGLSKALRIFASSSGSGISTGRAVVALRVRRTEARRELRMRIRVMEMSQMWYFFGIGRALVWEFARCQPDVCDKPCYGVDKEDIGPK